jgi:hypothetical protein
MAGDALVEAIDEDHLAFDSWSARRWSLSDKEWLTQHDSATVRLTAVLKHHGLD